MGKGNRSRANRADAIFVNDSSKKNKADNSKRTTVIVSILVALLLVVCILATFINNNGLINRAKTAATSDSYRVSGTMLSYFFNSQYQSFLNTYGSYASYFGLDTSKSLKSQKCTFGDAETWYDYFMNAAVEQIKEILCLAEAAKKEGIKLDDKDKESIDESIKSLSETAAKNGYTTAGYIAALFGNGVSVKDVKECLELSSLASKYLTGMVKDMQDKVTDDQIEQYLKDHPEALLSADTLQYVFTATKTVAGAEATEAEKKAYADEKAAKKALAEELKKAATSAEEFKKWVAAYLNDADKIGADFDSNWKSASSKLTDDKKPTEQELKDAKQKAVEYIQKALTSDETVEAPKLDGAKYASEYKTAVSGLTSKYITQGIKALESNGISYSDPTEKDATDLVKFLFKEGAAAGNVEVIASEGDTKSTYTVVFITEPAHKDESDTRDVAHILISSATAGYDDSDTKKENAASDKAKAEAEKILAELAGKDLEAFKKLGEEKTEDSNVVYENVKVDDMVTEFNDWLFDESRKPGDTGIVKTTYGYHVMYYIGEGLTAWKATAKNGVVSETLEKWYEESAKTYNVSFNKKVVGSLG
ncbi:MAG: peptidylprolyl isomerase [Clostridia bacterium]|nr:peptidylprolyl isomerase [Clostridia bacterium]